ncbi:DcaP family trimeric outer membrane transporter [Agarivorans sp. QJM3NY_29]|uniref:DcaP family trimeric outer membrane transporter n=1 Tax=unclassified Agarivorans TaxID=2636026 RepID=UPI003D7EFC90
MKTKLIPLAYGLILASTPCLASDIDYQFGGSIKTIITHDSDAAGVGINIPANSLYGKSHHSDTKLDASLSQFKFAAVKSFRDGSHLQSLLAMDFNANNDASMSPRLREAYLSWQWHNSQILAGQTWSTFMDMRNYPLSLAEPTLSGVVFKRQTMVRWSQTQRAFKYDLALENGTNSDIQNSSEDAIDNSGSSPDLIIGLEWTHQHGWLRASSAFTEVRLASEQTEFSKLGYGVQLSGGWSPTPRDQVSLLAYTGQGTDRYLLGLSNTGSSWNSAEKTLDLRTTHSVMASYTRYWRPDLKSVLAYGRVASRALDWQDTSTVDTFTSSQYGLLNLLWNIKPDLMLGLEYNYSQYERNITGTRDNHRVMLGMEWKY